MGGRHVFLWMGVFLLLGTVACRPVRTRARRDIPLDFEALAEMPVEHFGLIDDYGVLPIRPSLHHHVTREQPKGLVEVGKSKRDEPDIGELYYDDIM